MKNWTFGKFGLSESDLAKLQKFGINYDKNTRTGYLKEWQAPSQCTESDIISFEKRISHALPEDYRSFLLEFNGGIPKNNICQITDNSDSVVQHFFAVCSHLWNVSFDYVFSIYNGRFPANTLPVASDASGNLFLLKLDEPERGAVFFWDHEEEMDNGAVPDYSNMSKVAVSVCEFINSLKSEREL